MRDMFSPSDPPEYPMCPICGCYDYEDLYIVNDNEIIGCSECVTVRDASDYWAEQLEDAREAYYDMKYEQIRDMKAAGEWQ